MEVTRNGPVLVLRGGDLCVHVRPGRGGRIDRLFHGPSGGFQPVFVSGTACRTPRPGDAFEEHDTCGLDDGFPTLLREIVELPDGPVVYPDHGEIWSTPMEWRQDGDALTLFMESRLLPYQYEKTLRLEGDCLHLHWRIRNTGRYAFPCLWTFHGLFRYSPDLRVRLPESDGNGALCTCANPRAWGRRALACAARLCWSMCLNLYRPPQRNSGCWAGSGRAAAHWSIPPRAWRWS